MLVEQPLAALNLCFLRHWVHLALGLPHIPGQPLHKEDMDNMLLYDEISKDPKYNKTQS